jgi:hypothetical protein
MSICLTFDQAEAACEEGAGLLNGARVRNVMLPLRSIIPSASKSVIYLLAISCPQGLAMNVSVLRYAHALVHQTTGVFKATPNWHANFERYCSLGVFASPEPRSPILISKPDSWTALHSSITATTR